MGKDLSSLKDTFHENNLLCEFTYERPFPISGRFIAPSNIEGKNSLFKKNHQSTSFQVYVG